MKIKILPEDKNICAMIFEAADAGMPFSQLEYLGVSYRTLCCVEDQLNVVYLSDFLNLTPDQISCIYGLGKLGYSEIVNALKNFDKLNKNIEHWEKSTPTVEMYKKTIDYKVVYG